MPKDLDVLIVEDSMSYALELEMICEELGYTVLGTVADSGTALDIIFSSSPDLILMDISINGRLTGLEIGKQIEHLDIPVLYITSYGSDENKQLATGSNNAGFLVKPIEQSTIKATLNQIMETHFDMVNDGDLRFMSNSDEASSIFLRKDGVYRKIVVEEILYVQSEDNYCRFFIVSGESYLMRITLREIEKITAEKGLIRCHRRYIINTTFIKRIDTNKNTFIVSSEAAIPYSRSKKELVQQIGLLLS